MRIYSWNVNGINAVINKGALKDFIDNAQPDILCLNETKTDPKKIGDNFNSKIPSEYQQHWNCCKSKKGYSGVAIFTKIKPLKVTHDFEVEKHAQEGRTLTMEFDRFIVVACYVPNAGEGLHRVDYRTE